MMGYNKNTPYFSAGGANVNFKTITQSPAILSTPGGKVHMFLKSFKNEV